MTQNESVILDAVRRLGPCSCKQVMDDTGLSRAVVYRALYKNQYLVQPPNIVNRKYAVPSHQNRQFFTSPGQYELTPQGLSQQLV